MMYGMKILGIETSCDETGAAVVELGSDGKLTLLSNALASSMDLHIKFGGVVPEVAARSHIEFMTPVVDEALSQAFPAEGDPWKYIDAIAVTQGPGLGGSLLVGLTTARTLALVKQKPLYAINHVMAHPFAACIDAVGEPPELQAYKLPDQRVRFPFLALIVSGGHSQLVLYTSITEYTVIGKTRDDAVGEAFDKVAKILGLPYPGGLNVSIKAREGDKQAFALPQPKFQDAPYDLSYSGLKTAVLRAAQSAIGEDYTFPSIGLPERLSEAQKADLAASFEHAALKMLVDRTKLAYEEFKPRSVVLAGGVAASPVLRAMLEEALPDQPIYPDMKLCTDNAAMIAALGCLQAKAGVSPADPHSLDIKPAWPM